MKKQRIEYSSPVDALVVITKRLNSFENKYHMSSEDFFDNYTKGDLSDNIDNVEWANDYQHYLALKNEIESLIGHVA
jgi:hypothetical protein